MGEKLGLLVSIFIFGCFIVPFQLDIWHTNQQTSELLNVSTEIQQMVAQEGGITPSVQQVADQLAAQGASVSFTNASGAPITGKQEVGTKVNIDLGYSYAGVYQENTINTGNSVIINRR